MVQHEQFERTSSCVHVVLSSGRLTVLVAAHCPYVIVRYYRKSWCTMVHFFNFFFSPRERSFLFSNPDSELFEWRAIINIYPRTYAGRIVVEMQITIHRIAKRDLTSYVFLDYLFFWQRNIFRLRPISEHHAGYHAGAVDQKSHETVRTRVNPSLPPSFSLRYRIVRGAMLMCPNTRSIFGTPRVDFQLRASAYRAPCPCAWDLAADQMTMCAAPLTSVSRGSTYNVQRFAAKTITVDTILFVVQKLKSGFNVAKTQGRLVAIPIPLWSCHVNLSVQLLIYSIRLLTIDHI